MVVLEGVLVTFNGSGLYYESGSSVLMMRNGTYEMGRSTVGWDGSWSLTLSFYVDDEVYWKWKVDSGNNSYFDQYTRYVKIYNSSKSLTIYSTFDKHDSMFYLFLSVLLV